MNVELPVVSLLSLSFLGQSYVFSYRIEEYALQEDASLSRLHLRYKNPRCSMTCLWRPVFRLGQSQHARPTGECGDNFERFRQGPRLVS